MYQLIAVEVPENAFDFSFDKQRRQISATLSDKDKDDCFNSDWFSEKIPDSGYRILGTLKDGNKTIILLKGENCD